MSELLGFWELCRYFHAVDQVSSVSDDTEIQAWLRGSDDHLLDVGKENTGLQLLVRGDSFSERVADFSSLMFDIEGVQVNDYQPMSGKVFTIDRIEFLIPDGVPEHTSAYSQECALRYEDGDTKVCDTIRRSSEYMVRQLSVVTDELYLDRMTLVYCRSIDRT